MGIDAKEKTAYVTSCWLFQQVETDERQSIQTYNDNIITTETTEINDPEENPEEYFRQMQRMADPGYLHTVSLNSLYETVYQSRPPVIDGLLYTGTYLFAGAPKVGKSFFMAQLAYHNQPHLLSADNPSGIMMSVRERFYISPLMMITRDYRNEC